MSGARRLLLAALLLMVPPVLAQPSPPDVVDAFHFALKAGKRQQALELLTSDVLIFEQGRVERSRTAYARRHLAQDIAFASATARTVARRQTRVQGNAAWVTSINRIRGKVGGQPVDVTTDETIVLVRVGSKWRIAHIHWSFEDSAARH